MIEELNQKHLDSLKKSLNEYDEFWNEKILEDEFNNQNSKYYVLIVNDFIAGFGGLWFNIDEAHIMNIAVCKNMRKNGYGTEMLKFLINVAKDCQKKCITLEVKSDNLPAIKLYNKLGFEIYDTDLLRKNINF
jgi:ribosomal-protein-alanine N-acetyltransferase